MFYLKMYHFSDLKISKFKEWTIDASRTIFAKQICGIIIISCYNLYFSCHHWYNEIWWARPKRRWRETCIMKDLSLNGKIETNSFWLSEHPLESSNIRSRCQRTMIKSWPTELVGKWPKHNFLEDFWHEWYRYLDRNLIQYTVLLVHIECDSKKVKYSFRKNLKRFAL